MFASFATLLYPGDEVLLIAPYWTTYPESIKLAGGAPVVITTDDRSGFQVMIDRLDVAKTDRSKVLLFDSPSNPTGAVYPKEAVEAIGRWALENNVWVVTDEIYEHLTYAGASHHSMPVLVPELADQCIVLNGVAKTYAMTGWRVGWMIAPLDVITAATGLQSHATSNVENISQRAALAAASGPLDAVNEHDLADAVRDGVIAGVAIDVFDVEPTTESPLYQSGTPCWSSAWVACSLDWSPMLQQALKLK